ncbi:MAG: 4Fe-4S ferredoxin [Candidatus Helarchaeota archaeon]
MSEIEEKLRSIVKNLLKDKKVDVVIGYENATLPLRTRPCLISEVEDADRLVWNSACSSNLAKYLPYLDKNIKIGVVSKGCVGRTIIHLSQEKQIDRNNIIIIAIPCSGIVDRRKIESELLNTEILDYKETKEKLILKIDGSVKEFQKSDYYNNMCVVCKYRTPPIYDVLVDEISQNASIGDYDKLNEIENMTYNERWEYFTKLLDKCIRCYSCREACPMCYCDLCFVDQSQPTWFDKTPDISEIIIFHLIRAMHLAGRCVGCGDCSNACPMGIDLTIINQKLEKIVKDRFDFIAGVDLDTPLPLATYKFDDKEDYMIKE